MPLLSRDEVPMEYQEKLILSGYRTPGLSAFESVWSVFQWNNETFNFWSHFLVLGYFIWKCVTLDIPDWSDHHYWPLLCACVGSFTYPLLSSVAHAFSSMDVNTRHLVFYLDYMGISVFSCTSSIAFLAYSSPAHILGSSLAYFFAYMSGILAVMACVASCMSRHVNAPGVDHLLRLSSFSVPFIFTTSFLLFWLFYNQSSPPRHHYPHILWNPMIGLVNAWKFPERFIPFHFDVIGHSHQIFHIVVFIATNYQINALSQDCFLKKDTINLEVVSRLSVQIMLFVFIADTMVVVYHVVKLYTKQKIIARKNC